jgi:hypothetical protein
MDNIETVSEIDYNVCDFCFGDATEIISKQITILEASKLQRYDYWEEDDGSLWIEINCCGRMI